jgi:hypothetical protein
MPKILKYVERLCANCADYEIIVKPREGLPDGAGPFCHKYGVFFPEPLRWLYNPLRKKPGDRSCKHFNKKQKGDQHGSARGNEIDL